MPRSSLSSMFAALRFLALFCAVAMALHAQTPPAVPKLAVEIREAPGEEPFVEIINQLEDTSYQLTGPSLLPLAGYESKDHALVQPSHLDIYFQLHGDVMDIKAGLRFAPASEANPLKMEVRQPDAELGSYKGRLGDTISLDKMTELGFQPVTIKIVSPERRQPASLPIVNHVPSMSARVIGQDHVGYTIALHNLSAQDVTAFIIKDTLDGDSGNRTMLRGGQVVIAAHENSEYELHCPDEVEAGGSVDDRGETPCAFVLEAALFANGSYEGDANEAAKLEMDMLSWRSQIRRVRQAMQAVLDDKDVPESSRMDQMRAAVSNLTYQPDSSIREQLSLKFPGISDSIVQQIDESAGIDLDSMKTGMLDYLKRMESSPEELKALAELLASPEMN